MAWITPFGMPIIQVRPKLSKPCCAPEHTFASTHKPHCSHSQPYRTASTAQVRTLLQHVVLATHSDQQAVNRVRQRAAFPPNYVHSLDASHMLMTAVEMNRRNYSFAAVHDSYWTHAGTITEMNQVLRQEFINLYSQPLLDDLHASLTMRFPHTDFKDVPERGTLNIKDVAGSDYFFA